MNAYQHPYGGLFSEKRKIVGGEKRVIRFKSEKCVAT